MSIILKGVKLPEGAAGHIVGGAVDLVVNDGEALTEYRHYFYDAVEIPTPHGRIIDADKIDVIASAPRGISIEAETLLEPEK